MTARRTDQTIRYPKANLERVERETADTVTDGASAKRKFIEWGEDGCFIAFGTLVTNCLAAAKKLKTEDGLDFGVINARFVKPLDTETILKAVANLPLVVTVEEGTLVGGFGSAVLEAANTAGLSAANVLRKGLPDKFVEHGERSELLVDLGLDAESLANAVRLKLRGERPTRAVRREVAAV